MKKLATLPYQVRENHVQIFLVFIVSSFSFFQVVDRLSFGGIYLVGCAIVF